MCSLTESKLSVTEAMMTFFTFHLSDVSESPDMLQPLLVVRTVRFTEKLVNSQTLICESPACSTDLYFMD